ncbi:hypothetical protein Q5M85_22400 [Paraclostridium bifermentans]|nr:hypothetical protein [Paraclostridium bifermentans]
MSFNFADVFLSQFMLMFIAIVTGLIFGKLKFGKFKFGISGALFTGLIIGWGLLNTQQMYLKVLKHLSLHKNYYQ